MSDYRGREGRSPSLFRRMTKASGQSPRRAPAVPRSNKLQPLQSRHPRLVAQPIPRLVDVGQRQRHIPDPSWPVGDVPLCAQQLPQLGARIAGGDQRLAQLGLRPKYGSKNPFGFMELQDVQELTNFFERTVAAYQVGVEGNVAFDEDF